MAHTGGNRRAIISRHRPGPSEALVSRGGLPCDLDEAKQRRPGERASVGGGVQNEGGAMLNFDSIHTKSPEHHSIVKLEVFKKRRCPPQIPGEKFDVGRIKRNFDCGFGRVIENGIVLGLSDYH